MILENGNCANYDSNVKISFPLKNSAPPPGIVCPGKFREGSLKNFWLRPPEKILEESQDLQTFKRDTPPKNDCNFTIRLPNLMNDISNKTYRSTESKEVKKLWSKVMSSSE